MSADSLGNPLVLPVYEVSASIRRARVRANGLRLSEHELRERAEDSVEQLAPLLPSTRASVNSRGETLFMIRGAPERQIGVELDDVPLTIPWDERADVGLVPTMAIGQVECTRGIDSVLDPPNAVGGMVRLSSLRRDHAGRESSLSFTTGESNYRNASALHVQRHGAWSGLAALGQVRRTGFLLPQGQSLDSHQDSSRRQRTNSDRERSAGYFKLARAYANDGELRLTIAAQSAVKGVPPESHLRDGARFWRIPDSRRVLAGLNFVRRSAHDRRWHLEAGLSADFAHQEIRAYDDARYETPPLMPGADLESSNDTTLRARVLTGRGLSASVDGSLALSLRNTHHAQSDEVDGRELDYVQNLWGIASEIEARLDGGFSLIAGLGLDGASTPETGDLPARAGIAAPNALLRLGRALGHHAESYVALSRRSRFASLRELYSGALGRFVPNPDLDPEDQSGVELGVSARGRRLELSAAGFAYDLRDGIVRRTLDETDDQGRSKFQRVNEERIRAAGLETTLSWRPAAGWRVDFHHGWLVARARDESGGYAARVEDRPSFLSYVAVNRRFHNGLRVGIEALATGRRSSLDANTGTLVRLAPESRWNARAAYELTRASGWWSGAELFARVTNVLDARAFSQVGLPEAGRQGFVGLRVRFSN